MEIYNFSLKIDKENEEDLVLWMMAQSNKTNSLKELVLKQIAETGLKDILKKEVKYPTNDSKE